MTASGHDEAAVLAEGAPEEVAALVAGVASDRAATVERASIALERADALAADLGLAGRRRPGAGRRGDGRGGEGRRGAASRGAASRGAASRGATLGRSLRFAARQRMLGRDYWLLYARWLRQRMAHPEVDLEGMVFFGRGVDLTVRRRAARMRIGAWCWLGNQVSVRAHEGQVRVGRKTVLGSQVVVNAFLDVAIGEGCLFGDWIYVCDFDHVVDRVDVPIRAQGVRATPVRVGEDVWVGEKASILRGADVGAGSVVASQSLVRGEVPPFSVVVGTPARVVRSRLPDGMTVEEALDLQHRGRAIPGDPVGG